MNMKVLAYTTGSNETKNNSANYFLMTPTNFLEIKT